MKGAPRNKAQKLAAKDENLSWELKVATEKDVQPTVEQLTDHMNDEQRQTFRDKIHRYVEKPDRDLILAVRGPQVLGLVCVIEQAELPRGLSAETIDYLKNFAYGTQLLGSRRRPTS